MPACLPAASAAVEPVERLSPRRYCSHRRWHALPCCWLALPPAAAGAAWLSGRLGLGACSCAPGRSMPLPPLAVCCCLPSRLQSLLDFFTQQGSSSLESQARQGALVCWPAAALRRRASPGPPGLTGHRRLPHRGLLAGWAELCSSTRSQLNTRQQFQAPNPCHPPLGAGGGDEDAGGGAGHVHLHAPSQPTHGGGAHRWAGRACAHAGKELPSTGPAGLPACLPSFPLHPGAARLPQ